VGRLRFADRHFVKAPLVFIAVRRGGSPAGLGIEPQRGEAVLNRLVGGAVFREADRIVVSTLDHPEFGEGREGAWRPHWLKPAKNQGRAAIRGSSHCRG